MVDVRRTFERSHAVAILLALVAVPVSALAGQRRAPTQLPFRLSHGVAIEIQGRIGRLNHLRFVLDTGTTETVVDRRVADRLQLSCRRGHPPINFNRKLKMEECVLPDIEIGSFRVTELPVYVTNLSNLSTLADDADALIGLDLLGASRFTIDYATHEVTFDSMNRPAPPPANDPDDPLCMTTVVQVQGRPIRLIIDTGIQNALIYENRLRGKVPDLRLDGKTEEVNIGGHMPARRATIPDVLLGRTETDWVVFLIPGPPKDVLPGIDGYLGVSELKARRLTLDFVARTLTWER